MLRAMLLLAAALSVSLSVAPHAAAQEGGWRPPSREMPTMPRAAELRGDWLSPRAAWFNGLDRVAGVSADALSAAGEARPGSDHVQIARFTDGPVPVAVWSDRNSDRRADMIEFYRRGGVIIQLIDADYNGVADVLRTYDASGALIREERM